MKTIVLVIVATVASAVVAPFATAAPIILSISPNSAPVQRGTVVTVRGTGFATCIICSPPFGPAVFFGSVPAPSVHLIDSTELRVTTPSHLPGTVDVSVVQNDTLGPNSTTFTLPNAFTFSGDPLDGFETILLPIFTPPIRGAFGSEFHTRVTASAKTPDSIPVVTGVDRSCFPVSPPLPAEIELFPSEETIEIPVSCSRWPARLVFIPKETAGNATFNLRVLDVTRNALSQGTEIPIVRSADMKSGRVLLLNVPIDARFRNTLRIYSPRQQPLSVRITIGSRERVVTLQPGSVIAEPSIATLTDFPSLNDVAPDQTTARVTIDPPAGEPIWAFITVTNNETQEITTISPD